jgi:hypothetical protein
MFNFLVKQITTAQIKQKKYTYTLSLRMQYILTSQSRGSFLVENICFFSLQIKHNARSHCFYTMQIYLLRGYVSGGGNRWKLFTERRHNFFDKTGNVLETISKICFEKKFGKIGKKITRICFARRRNIFLVNLRIHEKKQSPISF